MLNKLKPTIAVIDSGIGGISVLNQLLLKFKTGNYIYFADNLFMPYGNKSAKFVKTRVEEIIESLNKNYQPDYVIVACNTASSVIDKAKYNNVLTIEFNKSKYADKIISHDLPKSLEDGSAFQYELSADETIEDSSYETLLSSFSWVR